MAAKFDPNEFSLLDIPERYSPLESLKHIRFSSKTNSLTDFDIELTPYLKTPFRYKDDPRVAWIYLIAPTQSGKTAFLFGILADCILQSPGTLRYCMPDEKTVKHVWHDRIIPLLTESPELNKHFIHSTEEKITMDNMHILPAWSNSPATVSSTPCVYAIADEIRLFKHEIKGEANALKQLQDRLTVARSLGRAQGYGVSSGGQKNDVLYNLMIGDDVSVLYWHLLCKHCKCYFLPNSKRDLIPFDTLRCPICKKFLDDHDMKRTLNLNGCYALQGWEGKTYPQPEEEYLKEKLVFRYNSIASPFRSFSMIKSEYLSTKDKKSDYKNYVLGWEADFWVDDKSESDPAILKAVRDESPYIKGEIPEDCQFLTAGVDVQGYGFNVIITAYAISGIYIVDNFVIKSNYRLSTVAEIAELFDHHIVSRIYSSRKGKLWKVALWGIDCNGFRSKETRDAVDQFTNVIKTAVSGGTQTISLRFNKQSGLYFYENDFYQSEVDILFSKPNFHLPSNLEDDVITQFTNIRKIATLNSKGLERYSWEKQGQTDYRSAFLESTVLLDVFFEDGKTLRSCLNKEDFSYNPYDDEMNLISNRDGKYMNDGSDNIKTRNYNDETRF